MSRGGHNWKGGGTVEGSRSLDVMKLARAGYLSGPCSAAGSGRIGDGTTASIEIMGGRDAITLDYRFKAGEEIGSRSTSACRSAGPPAASAASGPGSSAMSRPTACIAAGRLPSSMVLAGCSPADTATASATRCSAADQWTAPIIACGACIASWARITTVRMESRLRGPSGCGGGRIADRAADRGGEEHLDMVFMVGAQRILARVDRSRQRRGMRR